MAASVTRGRALRDADVPWDVRQVHDDPDAAATRKLVLADLENGVTSVWLHVGADGLAPSDVAEALADVRLDLAPVVVSSWDDQAAAADALYAVGTRLFTVSLSGPTHDLGPVRDLISWRDGVNS